MFRTQLLMTETYTDGVTPSLGEGHLRRRKREMWKGEGD